MRQALLLALLALTAYVYFRNSPASPAKTTVSAPPVSAPVTPQPVIIAAASSSSYSNRWKTGPNAQTDFEPFAPSEQAKWNQNPGYTIISGPMRIR